MGNRRRVRRYPGGYTFESCETINSVIDRREESERNKKPVSPDIEARDALSAELTDDELRRQYAGIMDFILDQINSVHGYLTAADIEARDALSAEMQRRHFPTSER